MTMSRLENKDPRILRWVLVMSLYGGRGHKVVYGSTFFCWLRGQILMIEDYSYEGANFRDDLELVLLKGGEWDDQGKY